MSVFMIGIIIKIKIKNRSHRQDINRPRSRHWHKSNKCKKCPNMMMLACIKQHQSNIWSSIHEMTFTVFPLISAGPQISTTLK